MTTSGPDPSSRRLFAALGLALVGTLGAYQLAAFGARTLPRRPPMEELAYFPSGQYLRPAALGHPEAAATLAWLKAVQYYGERRHTDNDFRQMGHVFDVITSLSPRFHSAYVFGAFALAQEGRDFPGAIALIEKGLEAQPHSGRLWFEAGFLHYVRPGGRDLREAAACFERAARLPDGPPQSARFAAFARQHAGDLRVALELWTRVADETGNPHMKAMADKQIERIRDAIARHDTGLAVQRLSTPVVLLKPEP